MSTWPMVKLGEVLWLDLDRVPVDSSVTYPMVGVLSFGKGLFDRKPIESGSTSYKNFNRLHADHVVMSQLFGWEGALALSSKKFSGKFLSPQFPTFACDPARLDRSFLGWLLRRPTLWEDLGSRASGMGDRRRTLTPDSLFACEIPLPPLSEQQRLASRIDAIAAEIEEAKQLKNASAEDAEHLLSSQLGKIFNLLENQHAVRTFGSLSPHVTSGPRNWATHYEDSGFRFYRAQDISSEGRISNSNMAFITPPDGQQGRTAQLQVGDLMLVITGATVGRVALYRKGLEQGFVNQHVALCRLPQTQINPEYALWGLKGPNGQSQLLGHKYGQGKPGLNLSNIRALALPLPPLAEQCHIVAELDELQAKVDALKHHQSQTSTELNALLPAVLDRAFKGEL